MDSDSKLHTNSNFVSIYNRNIKRVYQICYLYLKSQYDAEDACQSIFEKYIRGEIHFNSRDHEKAWFIVTSKNFCKDELRRFWRKKRVVYEGIESIAYHDGELENHELIEALLNLPVKYKDVIYLYYIEGYSIREISQMLNRNESTLRNHLANGRRLLKIEIGGYYYEE